MALRSNISTFVSKTMTTENTEKESVAKQISDRSVAASIASIEDDATTAMEAIDTKNFHIPLCPAVTPQVLIR